MKAQHKCRLFTIYRFTILNVLPQHLHSPLCSFSCQGSSHPPSRRRIARTFDNLSQGALQRESGVMHLCSLPHILFSTQGRSRDATLDLSTVILVRSGSTAHSVCGYTLSPQSYPWVEGFRLRLAFGEAFSFCFFFFFRLLPPSNFPLEGGAELPSVSCAKRRA